MTRLKPEFSDARICSRCGAPAERIGDHWRSETGEPRFKPEVRMSKRGNQLRYVCTRNTGEDKFGNLSMDHFYECGALTEYETTAVRPEQMYGRCREGDELLPAPDTTELTDRKTMAVGS